MFLEYEGKRPEIHEDAYVAPNAVIRGNVTIERGTSILFGATITAEGGPVKIGKNCVVMEQAVVRGTPKNPTAISHSVLVGPHAHLSGCIIDEEVFIATGSTIFNGVHIQRDSEVRINGVVHVNSVLKPESMVPIGWIAVGNPAQIFPPDKHDEIWKIQKKLDFPGTVWGTDREASQGKYIRSYAQSLQRHHNDRIISPPSDE